MIRSRQFAASLTGVGAGKRADDFRLLSCFFDGQRWIQEHVIVFLDARSDSDELCVAVAEPQESPLGSAVTGPHPAEITRVGFHYRREGNHQHVFLPSAGHFDLSGHAGFESFG